MSLRPVTVRHGLVALTALVGVAACRGTDDASTEATAAASSSEGVVAAVVPSSLSFSAPILGGGQLDGASLVGQAVMLWFWAPT
jgi:hypothetical protein